MAGQEEVAGGAGGDYGVLPLYPIYFLYEAEKAYYRAAHLGGKKKAPLSGRGKDLYLDIHFVYQRLLQNL